MVKRKIRIRVVRREPVDLDRLATALLALARQLAEEDTRKGDDRDIDAPEPGDEGRPS